ncbi:MAG: hypothetical protein ACRC3Y_00315 [Romboutsia sp.]|uniref:hypothetical protein n=1 Tax=Romboutsia sp. TaxID=1965302 RepID=UPI003F31FA5E
MNKNKLNKESFLSNFCSVRKIIAIAVTLVFCYLSIVGEIKASEFIPVFSMIIGYYFGKSTALDIPKNSNDNDSSNTNNSENENTDNTINK